LAGFLTSVSRDTRGKITQFDFNQAENEFTNIYSSGFVHNYRFYELGRKAQITVQDDVNTYTMDR